MREADGFSYARALGFQIVLAVLPALIFFVGVATWSDNDRLHSSVEGVVATLTPGPANNVLQQAVEEGEDNARGNVWAMLLGGVAALVSGAVGMSQVQKAASRLYGIEEDREWKARYGLSLTLSFTVGLLLASGFVALAFGSTIADAVEGESIWLWLRWPLAALALIAGLSGLYKVAPNRQQPGHAWLLVGGLTATLLMVTFSGGLAVYLSVSSTFGDTYGSIAGLIGLLIWAQLAAVAVLSGLAFAAQLEQERQTTTARTGKTGTRR